MSNGDLAVAVLPLIQTSIVIASCYWDILHDNIDPYVLNLISFCRERKIPLVLGMDSNAHSTLWGSKLNNTRGKKLEEWIFRENLTVINTGGDTFHSSRTSSAIDVTLTNEHIKGIGDWFIDEGLSFSDHKWIQFKYKGRKIPLSNKQFRNTRGADWGYFSDCLNDIKIPHEVVHTERGIENASDWLLERVWEGINEVAPVLAPFPEGRPRWWNKSLEFLRKMVRKASKSFQQYPNADNAGKYHMYRNSYTRQIRKAKKWAWKKFTTQLSKVAEIGRTAKALRFGRHKEIGILKSETGDILIDPALSMKELMRVHFPEHRPASLKGAWPESNMTETPPQIFNADVIGQTLRKLPRGKAPGPDGIPNEALIALPKTMIEFLAKLYQAILATGYTPKLWRTSKVIFIPKDGKDDYSNPKAYRPISLTCGFLKVMEKIIKNHLTSGGIMRELKNQFAFRAGCSTETAISKVVDELEKALLNQQVGMVAFLDIEGAFDRIPFRTIAKALKKRKVNNFIKKWYTNLICHRLAYSEVKGNKLAVSPSRGTPQGGVLSPLMWNLAIQDLLDQLEKGAPKPTGFADDICITLIGIDPGSLQELMQNTLNKVVTWGNKAGLTFNPGKTQIMVVTNKKKVSLNKLHISGTEIEYVENATYLGLTLNNRLNWAENIKQKCCRAKKALHAVKSMVGSTWGIKPDKMRWLYTAIARPVVSYAAIVWAREKYPASIKLEFNRLQRLGCMLISGCLSSAPTAGLEVILDLPPLEYHTMQLAMKARIRSKLWLTPQWDGIGRTGKGHQRALDDRIKNRLDVSDTKYDLWRKEWKSSDSFRQTKLFFPEIDTRVSEYLYKNFIKQDLCFLSQIFTGHACLKYHLHKMGLIGDSECRLCLEEEETAYHITFECPAMEEVRKQRNIVRFCNGVTNNPMILKEPKLVSELCDFLLNAVRVGDLLTQRVE